MAATTTPLITVSYGGVKHQMPIGVRPALELNDAEVDEAEEQLRTALRSAFSLPDEARLSVHETESGRSLSKESFRDPANLARFPKYWYLRVDNGYSSSGLLFDSIDREEEEGQLAAESAQLRELLMMEKEQPSIGEFDDTDTDSGLFPSLMELSMGGGDDSGSQDSNREDLMTMCMECDADGDYGLILRHFTVLAAVPNSENSSDGSGSRCDSRGSARSSESYDTLRMSSLFVHRIVSSLPAEQAGIQLGDIVYSVNGQCVAQSTTEEIKAILTNSAHVLTLCVQPERNDNLLFLYPQYSHGESGVYDKNQGEQIIVEDIDVKAGQGRFVSNGDHEPEISAVHLHNGESSMDDQWLQHSSVAGSQPPLLHSVGSNSFSPYNNPSFLPDDLLISGSLADIPVDQSPFLSRRHKMNIPGDSDSLKEMERLSSGGEGSLQQLADQEDEDEEDESSQEWSLSPQDKENVVLASPEWFPDSNVRHFDDSLSFPGSVHHSVGRDTTELSNKTRDQNSAEPKTFSQRLKDTFLNLTGGSNRKISRPDSASTNALDRLRTTSFTASLPDRSHSSECMRIKPPKKSRPSLNQLTRVSSADNIFSGESSWLHNDRGGGESSQPGSWRYSSEEAQPDIVVTEMPSALRSTSSDASPQFDENGKNLSGEEILLMSPGIKGRQSGRSYRSHRLKLHNSRTNSHSTLSEEEVSSPLSTSARRGDQRSVARIGSRAYRHVRAGRQLSNETVGSADLSPCQDSSQNTSDINKPHDGSFEAPTSAHSRYITSHRPLTKSSSLNRPSETTSTTHKQPSTQPSRVPVQKSYSLAADKSYKVPIHVPPPFSPNSLAAMGAGASTSTVAVGLASVTSAASVVRPVSSGGERDLTTMTSRDKPILREKPIGAEGRNRVRAVSMQVGVVGGGIEKVQKRPAHQSAVFQGHINKKQMKFANGRKSQDRTWRPLYAAIHGHQLVFYKDFKDAFTGDHLTSEPPINLRQCTAVAFSNSKNRKNKFKLTSSTGAECFIQAEDEEALKKWLQIVHSISYHTRRMTAPMLQNLTSSSQVETVSTSKRKESVVEKKRITRVYTPQPRGQRRQDKDDHSQRLFLRFLRKKQSNKEAVDADCTTYLTFGVPLEDCPASYENKRVPLLVAMCVSEIEQHWLETEGIYRMAGPIAQIRTLSNELNKGHFDLLKDHSDAHTITGVLKKFLKEIPNPLVPGDQYTNFVAAGKESEEKRHPLLKDLIKTLPPSHYHTLGFLIHHLRKVEVYSSENKMARRNLCMVFGPTLISKPIGEDDGSLVNDMQPTFNVIETFMNHAEEFFPDVLEDLEKSRVNGQSDLSQSAKLRAPFKRGTSGPPDLAGNARSKRSQGSSSQRKSWDSSLFNRVYSDDQLHADFTGSQDASQPMAHKKTRLSKTLGGLSSQLSVDDDDEDNVSMKDLVSPLRTKASPPSNLKIQFSAPKPRSNPSTPQRKISYVAAVQNGELVSPQTLAPLDMLVEEGLADSVFTHQGLPFTRRQSDPPHQEELIRSYTGRLLYQRQQQSDGRLRNRWSTDNTPFPPTEIIGPSSSTATWSNFSTPLQQSSKQESHL